MSSIPVIKSDRTAWRQSFPRSKTRRGRPSPRAEKNKKVLNMFPERSKALYEFPHHLTMSGPWSGVACFDFDKTLAITEVGLMTQ